MNNIEWKDELNKFEDYYGKILYMIYILGSHKIINEKEKYKLKKSVIEKNPYIFSSLEHLIQTKDIKEFIRIIKSFVNGKPEKINSKSIIYNALLNALSN